MELMSLRELILDKVTVGPLGATDPSEVFLRRISDELSNGPLNLPCFPDIVPRVRQALDDPRSTPEDIVRIAGAEPRLAARLLQTANSAVFNPSGKSVSHLRAAIPRIGHQTVQTIAMVFAMQQMKTGAALCALATHLDELWEKSIAVAEICQVLARQLKVPTDKVFLMGLLHGIGHFYIIVRSTEASSEITYDGLPTDLIAQWHPSLGRSVLTKWGFEDMFCEAVSNQNDHARESKLAADISDVLIASVVLAEALLYNDSDLACCENVATFDRLGLTQPELQAVLKHTEYSLDSLRETLAC